MSARRLTALLWTINLSAISASMFVYLYLAQHAYHSLGSLLVSGVVTPGEALELDYEAGAAGLRFEIRCGTRRVASGRYSLVTP